MCALTAGQRGRKVLLLDHAEKVGKKILISGGGRCNFTNLWVEPENYLSQNPHFCKSALSRFSPYDFMAMVEKHKIAYHEKTLGQLFCDDRATEIVAMLLKECKRGGVTIQCNCGLEQIDHQHNFDLYTTQGHYQTEALVIATGGVSIPKMGATDFGYQVAKQFGLRVEPYHPGLVPFTLSEVVLPNFKALAAYR